jgi:hypothetical protein
VIIVNMWIGDHMLGLLLTCGLEITHVRMTLVIGFLKFYEG